MLSLSEELMNAINPFMQLFSKRVWPRVVELTAGSILCKKQRTVSAILRVLGLSHQSDFGKYHRVFNSAKWSSLQGAKRLLLSLLNYVDKQKPLLIGLDEMLERRFGKRITQKGLYHDAARSLPEKNAFSVGLQWLSMMLVMPLPFSSRQWALPFFTKRLMAALIVCISRLIEPLAAPSSFRVLI